MTSIRTEVGDITAKYYADAVVNAANESLLGGGGGGMVLYTRRQVRNYWQNAGHYMVAGLVRQKLQKRTGFPVTT